MLPALRDYVGSAGDEGGEGCEVSGSARASRWIGGEDALLYLSREGLEACALCVLAALDGGHTASLESDDADGFTPLHFAANMGLVRLCAALLANGAPVSACTRDVSALNEPGGRMPLHLAAASGRAEIVALLLGARAQPEALDWQGATPFQMACRRGHFGLASQLARATVEHGGAESEVPTEQELRSFELVEAMAVRERSRMRRSLEGRPLLEAPFVLEQLLTHAQCAQLISAAERIAEARGWLASRHRYHATVDMPLHHVPIGQYSTLRATLDTAVLPAIRTRYATAPLRIREAFVVKYEGAQAQGDAPSDAPRQAGLGMHRDGTLLNAVVLLSDPASFEGGGTVFAPPLDRCYRTARGDCLCSCGQLLHGANAVTSGIRYVLIAFIDELCTFDDDDEPGASEPPSATPHSADTTGTTPSSCAGGEQELRGRQMDVTALSIEPQGGTVTSSGWMDAAERAERGFGEDEEVVMPLPNFDDSDEDGDGIATVTYMLSAGAPTVTVAAESETSGEARGIETSSGWMDAAERAERGFTADEDVVMPLPNFDDSDDD